MRLASLSPWICVIALVASCGCSSSQTSSNPGAANSAAAEQAAPKHEEAPPVVVPAGTALSITVDQSVSSKNTDAGVRVAASLAEPIIIDGRGVIPKGARVSGRVTTAKSAGRIKGSGELWLTPPSVPGRGQNYKNHNSTLTPANKRPGETHTRFIRVRAV